MDNYILINKVLLKRNFEIFKKSFNSKTFPKIVVKDFFRKIYGIIIRALKMFNCFKEIFYNFIFIP
jgi:hypothetical protein